MIKKYNYTRFSLFYFFLYYLTHYNIIGIFSLNTSIGVLISFESIHVIDPKALNLIKYECRNIPLCNYNSIFFYFYDFLIYESNIKLLMIVFLVILTLIFYIIASLFTKAFKISDIKLKY